MDGALKNSTEEDIFFIYDKDAMQNEYDTLEDSVLFYYPKTISDTDEMYLLFGQLVGMVTFTESLTTAIPTILCLEKTKFAVLQMSHYLLFLGCSVCGIPDTYLKNQLQKFIAVFTFYHGSIERLLQINENNREGFLLDLDLISSTYLTFAKGYGQILSSIFYPIQTVMFNKASSMIYQKVIQMLEACQRRDNVFCGCLFSESRIICSQLPPEFIHYLSILRPHQNNHPASLFYPGFDCPFGIRVLHVYVTTEQYKQIKAISSMSPYKKVSKNKTKEKTLNIRKLRSASELFEKDKRKLSDISGTDFLKSSETLNSVSTITSPTEEEKDVFFQSDICSCRSELKAKLSSLSTEDMSKVGHVNATKRSNNLGTYSSLDWHDVDHKCLQENKDMEMVQESDENMEQTFCENSLKSINSENVGVKYLNNELANGMDNKEDKLYENLDHKDNGDKLCQNLHVKNDGDTLGENMGYKNNGVNLCKPLNCNYNIEKLCECRVLKQNGRISCNDNNLNTSRCAGGEITENLNLSSKTLDGDVTNCSDSSLNPLRFVGEKISEKKDLAVFHISTRLRSEMVNEQLTEHLNEHNLECKTKEKEKKKKKLFEVNEVVDDMKELHLYVQAHSNTILVLLMEAQEKYDRPSFKSLWEMILPQLGDIEAQVKSLISTNEQKDSKQPEFSYYMKYNKLNGTCESNISGVVNAHDRAYFEAMNMMHHQFENSPSTTDITFKNNLTSVYAHQSYSDEIFYQHRGNYKPTQSAPTNYDMAWSLDQRSANKFKKLLKTNILL